MDDRRHQETRQLAVVLREDYERNRTNTAKVKANILEAIAALHDSLPQPGPLSVEKDAAATAAAEAKPPRPGEVKKAPTPQWLLKVGLETLTQVDGATVLVAEGLDGISSALAALTAASAAAAESTASPDDDDDDDANAFFNGEDTTAATAANAASDAAPAAATAAADDDFNLAPAARTPAAPAPAPQTTTQAQAAAAQAAAAAGGVTIIDDATRRRVSEAVLSSLALPDAGQRTDKTQAALSLLARHADTLAYPPGFMDSALDFFRALLKCRVSNNKAVRTLAVPALDEFLRALSEALADNASAPAAAREAVLARLSEEVTLLLDNPKAKNKEITTAVRAMGKLVRAAVAIGSQAAADLDAMMEKLAKLMMADTFTHGGNDFDRRFEAMERQAVMLCTYTDLISLQPAGTPVQESMLDLLVDIVRWVWEHYHTAGDRMQLQLHAGLRELCRELYCRGGSTLLAGVMSRVTRPLMALTLRVAPPDPVDSALYRAPPEPLWPRYVSLWVHMLGGDGLAVPGAPAVEKAVIKRRKSNGGGGGSGKGNGKTPGGSAAGGGGQRRGSGGGGVGGGVDVRQRGRSLSIDSAVSDLSDSNGDGLFGAGAGAGGSEEGHATVVYDAFIDELIQLCQTLQLGVVPARQPSAEEADEAEEARGGNGNGNGNGNEDGNGVGGGGGSQEKRRDAADTEDALGAMREALALELGEGVAAANPGDMQTFLCLVDLACSVISAAPSAYIVRWLAPLTEHLAALSGAHPLLSGFYKLARAALSAADRAGAFVSLTDNNNGGGGDGRSVVVDVDSQGYGLTSSAAVAVRLGGGGGRGGRRGGSSSSSDAEAASATAAACRVFLRDVLAGVARLSDELQAAALQLLLAAPPGLLSLNELAAPLRDALNIGLHHTPLAEAALDALESWLRRQGADRTEVERLLPSMVLALRPYVDRWPSNNGDGGGGGRGGGGGSGGGGELGAGADGAGATYRASRVAARRAHAADLEEAVGEGGGDRMSTRIVRLLGAVGGAAHALVDGDSSSTSGSGGGGGSDGGGGGGDAAAALWDPKRRVSIDIMVGGGPGDGTVRLTVWLDSLLPRAASLALTSADRSSKVAAAEFLHAATLLMVGRNARRSAPKGGDYAREPTPFHLVYRRLFPVIIDLAVDPEPVTRQLFSALAYQLVRWFTRNQAREAAETVALLDAVTEGLAGPSTVASAAGGGGGGGGEGTSSWGGGGVGGRWSGGGGGGGGGAGPAAAQRRDLCAALAAECLRWSVKHLPAGSGGGSGGGGGGGVAVNVKSILRRLFAFQTHPEPSKRLGASVALQRCLTELRQYPSLMEAHALEILEVTLRSLRMAESDPPRAGAEEAGALLARAAVRACARHATALCRTPPAAGLSIHTTHLKHSLLLKPPASARPPSQALSSPPVSGDGLLKPRVCIYSSRARVDKRFDCRQTVRV